MLVGVLRFITGATGGGGGVLRFITGASGGPEVHHQCYRGGGGS